MDGSSAEKGLGKLALLSNVNMDYAVRMLAKETEVYRPEGYGNELGVLINPESSYHAFRPDITFLLVDLMELLGHELDLERAAEKIGGWFSQLAGGLREGEVYYVNDAWLWGVELGAAADPGRKAALEGLWQARLEELCRSRANVRIFPYRHVIETLGEERAFSLKTWYMGKVLHSSEALKRLWGLILEKARWEVRVPRKVLLLDLDNTLWGGLAGGRDHSPIALSEDHEGLAYKNLQRVLAQMQEQGVLLGIVSKNNQEDAMEILQEHPHMVLRPCAFAARRINWEPKHENVREIAKELNLGLDSIVFWDDSPAERQLVREMLPQVAVPDFPERPEELAPAMVEIHRNYFARPVVTREDREKTAQYGALAQTKKLQEESGSFEEYLERLETRACRVDPGKNLERLVQLMNKTNQFNLTTQRYTQGQLAQLLQDAGKQVYLYQVRDKFGDHGIVAAAVADCSGMVPVITDFVMSCRIMGKNIEYALVEDMEADLRGRGYGRLRGRYVPTSQNSPAASLYERLGYSKVQGTAEGGSEYEICLKDVPVRKHCVRMEQGLKA